WLSTGGVVIAMFLTARRLAPEQFVAALVAYFLATDVLRALTYAALGLWTAATVALYLRTAPIALAGYAAGLLLRRFLASERVFRAAILILLSVYAIALIVRAALTRCIATMRWGLGGHFGASIAIRGLTAGDGSPLMTPPGPVDEMKPSVERNA